jgi:hypothetical protein
VSTRRGTFVGHSMIQVISEAIRRESRKMFVFGCDE